jgi:hypothetical protein
MLLLFVVWVASFSSYWSQKKVALTQDLTLSWPWPSTEGAAMNWPISLHSKSEAHARGDGSDGVNNSAMIQTVVDRHKFNEHANRPALLGDSSWAAPWLPRYLSAVESFHIMIGPGCQTPVVDGSCTDPRQRCQNLCDHVRSTCCALNTRYGYIPGETWGRTPANEMKWAGRSNCHLAMGGPTLAGCPYNCPAFESSHISGKARPTEALCKRAYDLVLLNTFPNSGTSWTKQVFDVAANYSSASVYAAEGGTYISGGNMIEFYMNLAKPRPTNAPALIKSHRTGVGCTSIYMKDRQCDVSRVLHYVRDPFDNLIARWKYVSQGTCAACFKNSSMPIPPDFDKAWKTFALSEISIYIHWHCLALDSYRGLPTKLVQYEQLLDNPVEGFGSVLQFIGAEYSQASLLAAIIKNQPHRSKAAGRHLRIPQSLTTHKNFFTPDVADAILSKMETLLGALAEDPGKCFRPWGEAPDIFGEETPATINGFAYLS